MICPFDQKNNCKILFSSSKKIDPNQLSQLDLKCTNLQHAKPTLYKCEDCNLIFSEFCQFNFENIYSDVVDQTYIDQIEFKKKYFLGVLKKIKNYLHSDTEVLEIGSYYGVLGDLIKPLVKKYEGVEISSHAVEYSKKKNLDVYNESIEDYLKKKDKLDVVIMSHVIEHLDDPFNTIKLIEKKMSNKSILILSTYNMDSFIAKILGKSYHWIMPMHKYYFTKTVLANILKKNNLEIFKIKTDVHFLSLKYLFLKLNAIMPKLSFIFSNLLKINLFNKICIKIILGDLDIYFIKKKFDDYNNI